MIRNYFKIAWRNLWKNKLQSFINLLGLTVGTVCCISIFIYVIAQTGYDKHHEDASLLYRIRTENKSIENNSINSSFATASPPIAFALKNDYPEVSEACRIVYFGSDIGSLLRVSDNSDGYYESRGYLADSTVFKIFTYHFTEGIPKKSLLEPNTIVLSSTLSKKLFGNKKALNKTLIKGSGDGQITLKVTGVFDDKFGKSHLNPNYFISMNTPGLGAFVRSVNNFATQNFVHTYIKLASNTSPVALQKKLPEFLQKHGAKDLAATGFDKKLFLQKVTDIHLYSDEIKMQIDKVSSIKYLYILFILAIFIQLVACINFINISTALANKRAKEIGIRKTIGANKTTLIKQFLGESLLLSFFACLISIPLTAMILPLFNSLTEGNLEIHNLLDWKVLASLFILALVTGIFAGIYPALILSSVKPIKVLKGIFRLQPTSGRLRKTLVIFQFVISIGLIVTVIIITQQVRYSQQKDLGFNKDNLIAIRLGTDEAMENFDALQNQISGISGVAEIAGSNRFPSEFNVSDMGLHLPGKNPKNKTSVIYNGISPGYFKTVGTTLLTGRDLRSSDSIQVVVNKATIDAFNINIDNAIGSKLISEYEGNINEFEIVGVTSDYHFASLKEAIRPILLFNENQPSWLILRTETTDFKTLLLSLEKEWKKVNTNTPFLYRFVDKEVEKLFAEEKRLANISVVFTGLAILLSCLGLFGFISFLAEQKQKEIGIRKVLGASISSIVKLLTKDFTVLVIIAMVIATPLSYYFMSKWLQDFEYKIEIEWWVFLLAGCTALIITFITVSYQAIKAAIINPTKSLRTE